MLLYDFLFFLFFILAVPLLAVRGKLYRGYLERLGFIAKPKKCEKSIWIHAVSVGEILSTKELVKALKKEFPGRAIVITTVTETGNKIARQIAGKEDFVTYLPLDISFIIKRFIKRFDPKIFIALETEIWPNLITQLSRAGIPRIIINGRISNKSVKRYKTFGFFLKPVLAKINCFAMQSRAYADKIIQLGVLPENVVASGNMKFDAQIPDAAGEDSDKLRQELRLDKDEKLFLAGCTHKGEEEIVLKAYEKLKLVTTDIRLLIAPRHIERIKEVENKIVSFGYKPVRISRLRESSFDEKSVYLLDLMGVLKDYYALCFCAFVGGSLVPFGGHNILEPANFAKPIIFGRFMHNFSDIRDLFLENAAAIEINNSSELEDRLRQILENSNFALSLGLKAKDVVNANKGATSRNIDIIKRFINQDEKISL